MPRMAKVARPVWATLVVVRPGTVRTRSVVCFRPCWSIVCWVTAAMLKATRLTESVWRVAVTTTSSRAWDLPPAGAAWAKAWVANKADAAALTKSAARTWDFLIIISPCGCAVAVIAAARACLDWVFRRKNTVAGTHWLLCCEALKPLTDIHAPAEMSRQLTYDMQVIVHDAGDLSTDSLAIISINSVSISRESRPAAGARAKKKAGPRGPASLWRCFPVFQPEVSWSAA